jgi:ankyrin repeat protein
MFTNEEKLEFLACDSFQKFQTFIDNYEINKFDNSGNTILHYYLKNIDSFNLDAEKLIGEMINQGLNINAQSSTGKIKHTPLSIAVQQDLKSIFDLLIDLGANVNAVVDNGNSILFLSVINYRGENGYFIERLILKGADVYQQNDYGVSPISLANTIANYDVKKFFEKFKLSDIN